MQNVRLEIAVDNADAVLAAARGGAERLELCSSLADGGLTPSIGFIEWTLASVSIPVHCMVRPRGGNFCYTADELNLMERDILAMKAAGAHGVVLGVLTDDQIVDKAAMRRLMKAARPMRVVFHRAFDLSANLPQALEDVIATGADILLTSGGAPSLAEGLQVVAGLVKQAKGRIQIMGGAGVRTGTAAALWNNIPIDTIHASLRTVWPAGRHLAASDTTMGGRDSEDLYTVREEDVRTVISGLEPRVVPVSG